MFDHGTWSVDCDLVLWLLLLPYRNVSASLAHIARLAAWCTGGSMATSHSYVTFCWPRAVQVVCLVFNVVHSYKNNNNLFMALGSGLPGWASTRRDTHPSTILIIIQSFFSFFHLPRSIASSLFKLHPWHSLCTTCLQSTDSWHNLTYLTLCKDVQ